MSTKADYSGIALVGLAAVALLYVVNKSTGMTSSPQANTGGALQGLIGANAAPFLSQLLNANLTGTSITPVSNNGIAQLWSNGVFQTGNQLTDPGQVSVDMTSGAVTENPLSGMYSILSPLTMGFTS